jgi:tripartite ATP-independent transporter DctP family solute receptor
MSPFTKFRRLAAVLGTLMLALPLAGPAALAQDQKVIRISTPSVPEEWNAQMLEVFKDWLERSAPGQFDVEIHLNATLFAQGTEIAAMQRGNLEVGLISAQDISRQLPEWSIFTAGYLLRDVPHQKAVFYGPIGDELFRKVASEMDVEILAVSYLGTRQLNLREKRTVNTPDDLAGVNLRMPGSDTWQFLGKALGANPTPMAFNEVYLGLQTGTIDGQDNPLPTVRAAKFYEVTEQIVLTSHLIDSLFFAIAKPFWDSLTPGQQIRVRNAARAAVEFNDQNVLLEEQDNVDFFKEQGLEVSTPDVEAFRQRVQQMYLESEFSKDWPAGLLDQINATQAQ